MTRYVNYMPRNNSLTESQSLEKSEALRRLGHVILCGALHVAYATAEGVKGAYSMCALYRKSLLFANCIKPTSGYRVAAMLSLVNALVDSAENGRGTYTISERTKCSLQKDCSATRPSSPGN
jgi:hypothetical protein